MIMPAQKPVETLRLERGQRSCGGDEEARVAPQRMGKRGSLCGGKSHQIPTDFAEAFYLARLLRTPGFDPRGDVVGFSKNLDASKSIGGSFLPM